jgi:glycosyltransferase involved in cell wall biosynthesis
MKISIITPNYNTAKYLEQTIQSVLSQKGDFELEYIVIDGGSTDESLDILERYKGELKYISEKDKGQSDAINKGMRMATGDILAYINADDIYTDGTFEKVIKYFDDNPKCMWVAGFCKVINQDNKEVRKYVTEYKNWRLKNFKIKDSLIIENCISQPSTFWRKEILKEIGYFDESLHYSMDQDYWCRIALKYEFHLIPMYLANFRFLPDTKTGANIGKQLKESLDIAKKYSQSKAALFRVKVNGLRRIIVYKYISKILKQ